MFSQSLNNAERKPILCYTIQGYTVVNQGKSKNGRDYIERYFLHFVLYIGLSVVFLCVHRKHC